MPEGKNAATAELVVKSVEAMAQKEITLEVKAGGVSYELPTSAIDTKAVMEQLGAKDASMVPVAVTITKADTAVKATVEAAAKAAGAEVIGTPTEFKVTATYNGKTVEVSSFDKFVQRVIEVTQEQARRITTAIVKEADGTLRHVPTYVTQRDGKYFAQINSRTNSTYALIENEVSFADAKGQWYESIVNEMGSRKILGGKTEDTFDGDASITRAEFAAIIVRALGLPASGECSFTDVKPSDWFSGTIGTAVQYGLVNGYEDGSFAPDASITRQEAMAIIQRAAKVAEFAGTSGAITGFADASGVEGWAQSAAQFNVGSGLIVGSDGMLNPTASITRAESATVILRLLQKAELIDVRAKA